jgi:hypothetical protein
MKPTEPKKQRQNKGEKEGGGGGRAIKELKHKEGKRKKCKTGFLVYMHKYIASK